VDPAPRTHERLVGVAIAGAIALNYPILYLVSGPALFVYLFGVWAGIIALLAIVARGGGRPRA
jgi:hypothetical protein